MSSGGWRYLAPVDGLEALVRTNKLRAQYSAGAWEIGVTRVSAVEIGGEQVLASRRPPIAAPAGGSTVDAEARATVTSILAALRAHGLIAE